ncbi:hypothetical protein SAMN05216374_0978 [Tardiphaga sp. OK246]|uniref:hypothetical protein n=1 Tax=Tardiphaga sp. OK246 TaxID=1855307 RepID=UPI000B681702|nr:hypothetical protein [Tardiphaga sp. OK246]SNS36229.1 hypothetical protein SAMN05216374_0978 [Tardiphaga sp. OK246]
MLEDHREFLADDGEDILIRRYTGSGPVRPKTEAKVRARVSGLESATLIGAIVQGKCQIIAVNDPEAVVPSGMVALSALLPITTNDKAVLLRDGREKELSIEAADDNTRRVGGTLIALQIQASG